MSSNAVLLRPPLTTTEMFAWPKMSTRGQVTTMLPEQLIVEHTVETPFW